jgi:hypothetical protein
VLGVGCFRAHRTVTVKEITRSSGKSAFEAICDLTLEAVHHVRRKPGRRWSHRRIGSRCTERCVHQCLQEGSRVLWRRPASIRRHARRRQHPDRRAYDSGAEAQPARGDAATALPLPGTRRSNCGVADPAAAGHDSAEESDHVEAARRDLESEPKSRSRPGRLQGPRETRVRGDAGVSRPRLCEPANHQPAASPGPQRPRWRSTGRAQCRRLGNG